MGLFSFFFFFCLTLGSSNDDISSLKRHRDSVSINVPF